MAWQTCPAVVLREVTPDRDGEAVTILLSQAEDDPGGQVVNVYADFPTSSAMIGSFIVSARAVAPFGTRVAAFASLPGAFRLRALVQGAIGPATMPLEVACECGPASGYSPLTLVSP